MKLLIIEDQTMIRQLLVMGCRKAKPDAEIYSASNGAEGIELCRREKPCLVILDLMLPDCDGLSLVPDIRACSHDTKILVLSSHADEFTLHRVQKAGVNGFVNKSAQAFDVLLEALNTILAGQPYFCSAILAIRARMRSDPLSFSKVLSDREMKLLELLGQGLTNEEIGLRLDLRPNTVRNHRQNIMTKLGIGSTPQLIRYALSKGFNRMGR
jgi:two-component system response regulator NreC